MGGKADIQLQDPLHVWKGAIYRILNEGLGHLIRKF